ncbi:MAG: integrase arm-type DNA-binding domain-containing protein [bacterium]|nr:integrase arm-type DNA-binding domain-containing protein [bacterium]
MPVARLTDRTVKSATAGKWMTDYWDDRVEGFALRVSPHTGRKTFIVRYNLNGRRRRVTLGAYPALKLVDARDQAKEILGDVAKGKDPQAKKKAERRAMTFAELADVYLERHAKIKKRSWQGDQRVINVDLLPHWRGRKAKNIRRGDVVELLDSIVERGAPIMANRVKALISKIFNFGIGRDIVDFNPCHGVPMPAKARQRDRVLSEDEIRAVWWALDDVEPVMAATFKMRLLTAQRGLEVLSMRWADIDGDWWTIPAEVSKNGLAHGVPLSRQVRALLAELRPTTGFSPWVFESPRKPGAHISAVQKAGYRIAKAADVDFVPHDLRRTAATAMTSMGISRLVVSKILNHVESGVTAIYDRHSYDEEKREALESWVQKLSAIIERDGGAAVMSVMRA